MHVNEKILFDTYALIIKINVYYYLLYLICMYYIYNPVINII